MTSDTAAANGQLSWLHLAFIALGGVVLLLIVAPLLGIYLKSTFGDIVATARDAAVRESIWLTLWVSMVATLVVAVACIPFAYILARKDFPLKGLVSGIVDLPVIVPHSVAGIAILGVVARGSLLGSAAESMGFEIVGTPVGIGVAMAFVSVPFLINSARDGFAAVPDRLEKAALGLGASPLRMFFTVSVPLAWRAIVSGLVLMWGRGMSEFGAVMIIAYHPMTTPILIYERFSAFGLKYSRPISALFMLVCLVIFIALRILAQRRGNADR
ncbi:MAG: molybdenum ABC transporter permease [Candidatus Coatesbacteria bacterium]|nr:MAG: molybdenum ABC transporter permease [Candidatus Coatesbacteria bacterium]